MPTAHIDYSDVHRQLNLEVDNKREATSDDIISTPSGLSIIEIQGELNFPRDVPLNVTIDESNAEYIQNFVTVNDIRHAVKFGRLQFDEKDAKKVILFIGKSQRLLGTMVDLETPLAVLKIPVKKNDDTTEDTISMIDIISKKIIFKQRPLPVM
ncbi:chromosome transmission fidelity protein 8 [Scheffersomyces xylosifermentans]|uniref:chromosome transmission fidelity protein 8 n=1 Tax=Scheffersomyces xylosifermentans TaxID=1304137 RepID=UPI00315DF644